MLESKVAVSVVRNENASIIRVTGDVDLATVQVIEPVIRRAGRQPERTLVIDLSAVTFFGAVGVTLLSAADRRARLAGTVLRVVATQRLVLWPLEITGVADDFHIYQSVRAALLARPVLSPGYRCLGGVVIAGPRDPQQATGRLGSNATRPFNGIAEEHQGFMATILRAARFGWFTKDEADLLIDRIRTRGIGPTDLP